jgi:hypothetical protein
MCCPQLAGHGVSWAWSLERLLHRCHPQPGSMGNAVCIAGPHLAGDDLKLLTCLTLQLQCVHEPVRISLLRV